MDEWLSLPVKIARAVYDTLPAVGQHTPQEVKEVVVREIQTAMPPLPGKNFVRLAGVSGGLAVMMSAYGAHAFNANTEDTRLKAVFESGNKMHLIHSVALLGVPNVRKPVLVGTMMTTGMLLFCGSCYYQAITGDGRIRKVTPYGGMLLIISWFLMLL